MSDSMILVINCGSSSVKYQLINPVSEAVLAKGTVERIGEPSGIVTHSVDDADYTSEPVIADHQRALMLIDEAFDAHGPDLSAAGVRAVGHRVVHGGDKFSAPTVIDEAVESAIDALSPLAPLHNPGALMGIRAAREVHADVPHVAVFDTAFFADLPEAAYTYAIDSDLAKAHDIRRYGFHGTSHEYVSEMAAQALGKNTEELNQIVLHLGNGASASAIQAGRAIDTSMGLTPLEGLVMGTRSGDVDPSLHRYLGDQAGMSLDDIDAMLNKRSGLLGLSGVNDFRALMERRAGGDAAAELAFEVYARRIQKYVGGYLALLGRVDVLSFTAGVGEHNAGLRERVVSSLEPLGFVLDAARNTANRHGVSVISTDSSPTCVLVVPTNEELAIARATLTAVGG